MKRLLVLSVLCGSAHAQFAVIDMANLANTAKQVAAWQQQFSQMTSQIAHMENQYRSLTGSRGLGSILNNPMLRNALPSEYQGIYRMASSSNYGISGSLSDIASAERLTGSMSDMLQAVTGRAQNNAMTNKAVGLKAYQASQERVNQIDGLMGQIDSTSDPKAIAELQARIAIEQANLQNEQNKLALIARMQDAEDRLATQQRLETSRRILSSSNTTMAGFD